jgi:hypothetical protein
MPPTGAIQHDPGSRFLTVRDARRPMWRQEADRRASPQGCPDESRFTRDAEVLRSPPSTSNVRPPHHRTAQCGCCRFVPVSVVEATIGKRVGCGSPQASISSLAPRSGQPTAPVVVSRLALAAHKCQPHQQGFHRQLRSVPAARNRGSVVECWLNGPRIPGNAWHLPSRSTQPRPHMKQLQTYRQPRRSGHSICFQSLR